eukprot:m.79108 g.79108  ORF g.79108 m.79108 type:complete len:396 (-) comp8592_c1_seq2:235-1422(-)
MDHFISKAQQPQQQIIEGGLLVGEHQHLSSMQMQQHQNQQEDLSMSSRHSSSSIGVRSARNSLSAQDDMSRAQFLEKFVQPDFAFSCGIPMDPHGYVGLANILQRSSLDCSNEDILRSVLKSDKLQMSSCCTKIRLKPPTAPAHSFHNGNHPSYLGRQPNQFAQQTHRGFHFQHGKGNQHFSASALSQMYTPPPPQQHLHHHNRTHSPSRHQLHQQQQQQQIGGQRLVKMSSSPSLQLPLQQQSPQQQLSQQQSQATPTNAQSWQVPDSASKTHDVGPKEQKKRDKLKYKKVQDWGKLVKEQGVPDDDVDLWYFMKLIRLHKYTESFYGLSLDDVRNISDEELEGRGLTKGAVGRLRLELSLLPDTMKTFPRRLRRDRYEKLQANSVNPTDFDDE